MIFIIENLSPKKKKNGDRIHIGLSRIPAVYRSICHMAARDG